MMQRRVEGRASALPGRLQGFPHLRAWQSLPSPSFFLLALGVFLMGAGAYHVASGLYGALAGPVVLRPISFGLLVANLGLASSSLAYTRLKRRGR